MSDKFVFQNAQIKHRESKLLSYQTVQRLLECTQTDDAFKILCEAGFGAGISLENGDFDSMFEHEEQNAAALLKEMNVDDALDVFLMQYDYLNLKALLKSHVTGNKPVLSPNGLYDAEVLQACISTGDLSPLAPIMADAAKSVLKLVSEEKVTPHAIDTLVDRAMFKNIAVAVKKSGKLAVGYFQKKTDFINIASFVRCRKLGLSEKFFEESFIEGGKLEYVRFSKVYEASDDAFKDSVKFSEYQDIVARLVESADTVAFEVETDNALLKMWKNECSDMFSIAPIVAFYLTKLTEIKVAKLIVAGIKNHVDENLIRERMRDLYA